MLEGPVDPVAQIKRALRHIRIVHRATGLSPEDIEAISNDGDQWKALRAVLTSERALENALKFFRQQSHVNTGRRSRGRTGSLDVQAVARAMALAWQQLTERLPAKDNSKFHALLLAAVATIFGHPRREPRWESADQDCDGAHQKGGHEQALIGSDFFCNSTRHT